MAWVQGLLQESIMDKLQTTAPLDIPVDPISGPATIIPAKHDKAKPDKDSDALGETTAEPYENEG